MAEYTKEMEKAFHAIEKPFPMRVDIIKFNSYLGVSVDKANEHLLTFKQKLIVNEYLLKVQDTLESFGEQVRVFGFGINS